jgi:hypothetical protein
MRRREIEMTYSVSLSAVRNVYEVLTTPPSCYPERSFTARAKPPRTVLHLYLTATQGVNVRRIRVRRRHGSLLVSLDSKRVIREDDLLIEKDETIENSHVPLATAAEMLSGDASVASSFIKNQHRLDLRQGSRSLKVHLDQMLPFRADQPTVLGSQFWHLEIEEAQNWKLADFHDSSFVQRDLSTLHPLLESKWQTAALSPPVGIDRTSRDDFLGYLDGLLALGARASHSSPLYTDAH